MSTVCGIASTASRYSGKDSHSQVSPSARAVPGMSSTPSSSPMSQSWRSGARGREADAAVAHRDRRHPVERGRRDDRVPGDLAVEMRVDVDEAGRDDRPVRVDLPCPALVDGADRGDHPVGDRDVAGSSRCAGAVDQGAVADHEVSHHSPSRPCRSGPARRTRARCIGTIASRTSRAFHTASPTVGRRSIGTGER